MDIYEKKYKEALERARNLHKDAIDVEETIRAKQCEIIFPELVDCEDERIRGAIIDHLKDNNLTEWAAWLEKQGEQKSFDYENATIVQKDFASIESKFKDGDVLHSPSHRLIWIYKDNGHYHACVNMNYVTENITTNGLIIIPNDACPATKDEQTILFAHLKETGYNWDSDKRELKKIEQKPTEKEMIEALRTENEKGRYDAIAEMQVALSKEDEDVINKAESWLDTLCDYLKDTSSECIPDIKDIINKLKSLKERLQSKVELTQLDKNILEAAIAFVEQNNHFNYWGGVDKHTVLSALHSLRPQSSLKPSDWQMVSTTCAVRKMKESAKNLYHYLMT